MTTLVTCVAMETPLGQWYGRGAARLAESLRDQADVVIHHKPPEGTPSLTGPEQLYTPYISKPFALREACAQADVAILCDASFYALRPIQPLVEHIRQNGYYLCANGSSIGAWTSDACLKHFGIPRDTAMSMPDASSYCVGIDTSFCAAMELIAAWCQHSTRETICGAHTNWMHKTRRSRNPGVVSNERRCKGHRHDQVVLSLVAHQLNLLHWTARPKFTSYKGHSTEETVFECEGM